MKAKALGVPVCALFGGPYRRRLPLYWSHCASFRVLQREFFEKTLEKPPIRSLDDLAELGREAASRGFTALKANPLPIGADDRIFNPGFHINRDFLSRHADDRLLPGLRDVIAAFRDGAGRAPGECGSAMALSRRPPQCRDAVVAWRCGRFVRRCKNRLLRRISGPRRHPDPLFSSNRQRPGG